MGLFDSLFGGSSSSTQQQQTSSGSSFIDPTQAPFLDMLRRAGGGLLNPNSTGQNLASGLAGAQAGLIGQSVGPQATQAQLGSLFSLINQQQERGLNSIQNRFGFAGSTGSRAGLAGQDLVGNLGIPFAQGIAGILGQQSQLGLQGASQLPGIFGTQFAPTALAQSLIGAPTILQQQQSQGTRTGTESSSGGIFGGNLFNPIPFNQGFGIF